MGQIHIVNGTTSSSELQILPYNDNNFKKFNLLKSNGKIETCRFFSEP